MKMRQFCLLRGRFHRNAILTPCCRSAPTRADKEFNKRQGQLIEEIKNNRGLNRTEKIDLLHSIYEESGNQEYMNADNVAKIVTAAAKVRRKKEQEEVSILFAKSL